MEGECFDKQCVDSSLGCDLNCGSLGLLATTIIVYNVGLFVLDYLFSNK